MNAPPRIDFVSSADAESVLAEVAARLRAGDTTPGLGTPGNGISTLATGGGKGCNIAIGNVFEDKANAIGTSARRETTVIVTGDVIQVGNNCR